MSAERVNVYAGQRHYVDHLAPIWMALPEERRGVWICGASDATARTRRLGIKSVGTIRSSLSPRAPLGVWMIAGAHDLEHLGSRRDAILVEHGAGQTYRGDPSLPVARHASYAGGRGRQHVLLFLCPNQRVAQINADAYPQAHVAVVGCPKLDEWLPGVYEAEHLPHRPEPDTEPVVAFTWHWECPTPSEAMSALPWYVEWLASAAEVAEGLGFHVIGHGHPRAWAHHSAMYKNAGIEGVRFFEDVLARADVLVADNTSALFEFASTDRPVVVLNAPWYRRDVHHGVRFWEYADVGLQVNHPDGLWPAIEETIALDPQRDRRRVISEELYGVRDGRAAERAANAIMEATS